MNDTTKSKAQLLQELHAQQQAYQAVASERKRLKAELQLLQKLMQAISIAEDRQAALTIAIRLVCETTGWSFGEAWIPCADGSGLESSSAWYSRTKDLEKFRRESEQLVFSPGVGLPGRIWSSKQPEWIPDVSIQSDTIFARVQLAMEAGLRAALGIPILYEDRVLAVLVFFMQEAREEDKHLVNLVSTVATQLGAVLQCKWAQEALREAHNALEKRVEERTAELIQANKQLTHEIMERKYMEEALRESERRFRELLENVRLAAVLLDVDGRVSFCNDYLLTLLGYPREEVLGQNWFERFIPPEHRLILRQRFWEATKQGTIVPYFESEIVTRYGEQKIIAWNNTVLRDTRGNVVGTASIGGDLTERKRMEEEFLHTEKLALIGQLASGLAHEIGTPLGVIAGTAEFLMMETTDPQNRKELETIVSQTERISALIRQLLTFARPQSGDQEVVDVHQVLERSLRLLEYRFGKEHIQVIKSFQSNLPPLLGVSHQLEQVFLNILVNAWHAMPQGGTLTISTTEQDQMLVIQFRDTGQGIAPEHLSRIFEPFFTTKGAGKGTGLGLSVCQQLVRQHNGTIEVESKLGKGSLFTVKLPRLRENSM